MKQIHTVEQLQAVVVCLIVAVCASFVRVFLYKYESFRVTIMTFIGGIFFGTLVGYLIGLWPKYASLDKLCAATFALIGKEFVNFVIVQAPTLLSNLWDKFRTLKFGKNE